MIKKLQLKFFLVAAVPALLALHGCKNKSEAALEGNEQQTPSFNRGGAAGRAGGRGGEAAAAGDAKRPHAGTDGTQPRKEPPKAADGDWSTQQFLALYKTGKASAALETVYVDNQERFIKKDAPQKIEFIPYTWLYEPLYIEQQQRLMEKVELDKLAALTKDTLVRKP